MSGTTVAYESAIPNSILANSTITIKGSSTALGGSVNIINGTGFVKSSGTSITYDNSTYYSASNPNGYTNNTGTVTSITVSPGTGMSGGGTITTNGTVTLTNAAPDQTVILNNGTGISVTGTYPNFTISSTSTGATISSYIATGSVTASVNTDPTASFKVTSGSRTLLTLTNDSKLVIGTPGEFIDYQLEVSGAIKANGNVVVDSHQTIASSLYGTGQLLTGSAEQPVVYLESTWDTSANARGIELSVANTTSGASSKLLNLKVDSISMFNVSKVGAITTAAPSGYTNQPWKLGDATTGTVTPDTYITVEINGQIYSIPALLGTP
jgi:hypothetical protein